MAVEAEMRKSLDANFSLTAGYILGCAAHLKRQGMPHSMKDILPALYSIADHGFRENNMVKIISAKLEKTRRVN